MSGSRDLLSNSVVTRLDGEKDLGDAAKKIVAEVKKAA